MRNVKLSRSLSLSIHVAITALFILSLAPQAWSEETPPTAAPPATTDMSNEGTPPAPSADPGMGAPAEQSMGAPSSEAPAPEERVKKKKKKKKHATKKKTKHSKKKAGAKKKKKKKHHNNY